MEWAESPANCGEAFTFIFSLFGQTLPQNLILCFTDSESGFRGILAVLWQMNLCSHRSSKLHCWFVVFR